jgi:hypothetical protein
MSELDLLKKRAARFGLKISTGKSGFGYVLINTRGKTVGGADHLCCLDSLLAEVYEGANDNNQPIQ